MTLKFDNPLTLIVGMTALLLSLTAYANPPTGHWQGAIEVPGNPIEILIDLTDEDGSWQGSIDIPVQGLSGFPLGEISVTADAVTFMMPGVPGEPRFAGTVDDDGNTLAGTFSQSGQQIPFTLQRGSETQAGSNNTGSAIPAEALEQLSRQVQALVDSEEIIGGELHVIKNHETVFRQAYGWKDREAGIEMETGALYCVRSMTKPFVGTAIQMLIDEGSLTLDTPVHSILASFDTNSTRSITIDHLLTHTAGFPFTTLTRPLNDYASLADVAAEAAATELLFEPGARFEYSDAGSDTLGAIVAEITGMPVEQFIQQRILDPLAMTETVTLLGEDTKLRKRIPAAYSGGPGAWSAHWRPQGPALFPLFLSSQSLYSTTADYAKFLAWWMDDGVLSGDRLLSEAAVDRALTPHNRVEFYPETIDGVKVGYGHQWLVRHNDQGLVNFGHDGSDGTYAWAWPEQDLIVLFFTQSRGTPAGLNLEKDLHALLVERDTEAVATADDHSVSPEQLAGMYWDETNRVGYYIITPQGENLFLDRPGSMHLLFKPSDKPGRYLAQANPSVWIEFVTDGDNPATAMKTFFGDRIETDPRHQPDDRLPSVEDVMKKVQQAHRPDVLAALGTLRVTQRMQYLDRGMDARMTVVADGDRRRVDVAVGSATETIIVNGANAWTQSSMMGTRALSGRLLEQMQLDRYSVQYGDWRQHYETVEVIRRIREGDNSMLMVRVVPTEGPGSTMFVDENTGRVIRKDDLAMVPGMGIVGTKTSFSDFREVNGVTLPHRTTVRYANKLIGKVQLDIESVETHVQVEDSLFANPLAAKN